MSGLVAGCGGDEKEDEADSDAEVEQDAAAEEQAPSFITLDAIDRIVREIDSGAERQNNAWAFQVQNRPVYVITDPPADRMRIQVPVTRAERLDARDWQRVMSANFDTAIDARYATGQQVLWTVFVHRLSTLTHDDFVSGLRQCLNLMATYGTSYASTGSAFTGGDLYRRQQQGQMPGQGGSGGDDGGGGR